ncbi:MAG: BMP family ABC transporter substrate-binding protein [Ruminiclostridium sp.]|nr:BMP family ABC transporter substrate-binding protein [Ruminiclostridium sp.]
MKKIIITVIIVVVAIVAGIFMINAYEETPDVTEAHTKVGVILNGYMNDKSWSQSHYEGMVETAKQLNLDITYKEFVTTDSVLGIIDELVDNGCEIIIANSAIYSEHIVKAAEQYPEIFFFHATGTSCRKNLSTYFGRMYQMRYLTGIAAGLQTKTNEIGYAAAFPIPEVNRGINAFALGVRSVNPEAKVYVRWINSWNADMATANAAETLISEHNIDILAMHTDSLEPLRVADEHGVMSIGYNIDNSALYPETYLTAAVWDWEKFYTSHILRCLQGKFEGVNYWEGSDTGIMDIAPLSEKAEDGINEVIEAERARLNNGTFDVFYGPIYDNEGNLRVAEGESMTDEAMLNELDWYVEGVVIDG